MLHRVLVALVMTALGVAMSASAADFGAEREMAMLDSHPAPSWLPPYSNTRHIPTSQEENWANYKIGEPYKINSKWYFPKEDPDYVEEGVASWYGEGFHNRETANGEVFDKFSISAAHRTLPLPSMVRVTNTENGRSMLVRVNDRGPFAQERIIDLSEAAARALGVYEAGVARVRVEFDREATAALFYDAEEDLVEKISFQRVARHERSPHERGVPALSEEKDAYYVQTGAYADFDNARRVAKRLRETAPVRIEAVEWRGKNLYRVKVGPFSEASEADRMIQEVGKYGFRDAVVVAD